MEITALIGESGTGKSYKAIMIAKELDIEYIIDDGILIKGTRVIAGRSAKREGTTISAVKRAIFMNEIHRKEVLDAIRIENVQKILILGTSERMIQKIVEALELPPISKKVFIEDISNEDEIKLAKIHRYKEGKHVIPVPTFEIKKDFSGYFIDTLKIFKKKEDKKDQVFEKTVVRPTFSYLGKYTISQSVLKSLIRYAASKTTGVPKVNNIYISNKEEGLIIKVDVTIILNTPIIPMIRKLQEQIISEIEQMTSLNILTVDVFVKKIKKI